MSFYVPVHGHKRLELLQDVPTMRLSILPMIGGMKIIRLQTSEKEVGFSVEHYSS